MVQLPIEIVEHILDFLRFQPRVLKTCALVHTDWLPAVRPRLFHTIDFGTIAADWTGDGQHSAPAAVSQRRTGTSASYVNIIRIGKMNTAHARRYSMSAAEGLGSQFNHPNLQLTFSGATFSSVKQFDDFLGCFPLVKCICMYDTVSNNHDPLHNRAIQPASLREMTIGTRSHRLWVKWMSALAEPLHIRRLSLVDDVDVTATVQVELPRWLLDAASTIEVEHTASLVLNLSSLPFLRAFKVHCPLRFKIPRTTNLVKILNGLPKFLTTASTSDSLRKIHIISHITYYHGFNRAEDVFNPCDWDALDNAFCRRARDGSEMKIQWDIVFFTDNGDDVGRTLTEDHQAAVLQELWHMLPKCVAQGGLEVNYWTGAVGNNNSSDSTQSEHSEDET